MLLAEPSSEVFIDRRQSTARAPEGLGERRQFAGKYDELSAEGRELGRAVDEYKLMHRRQIITYDELASIMRGLNYVPGGDEPVAGRFVERRGGEPASLGSRERRQFGGSYDDLSPEGQRIGRGVDDYKVRHHRRFITYDEMLNVLKSLGWVRLAG